MEKRGSCSSSMDSGAAFKEGSVSSVSWHMILIDGILEWFGSCQGLCVF